MSQIIFCNSCGTKYLVNSLEEVQDATCGACGGLILFNSQASGVSGSYELGAEDQISHPQQPPRPFKGEESHQSSSAISALGRDAAEDVSLAAQDMQAKVKSHVTKARRDQAEFEKGKGRVQSKPIEARPPPSKSLWRQGKSNNGGKKEDLNSKLSSLQEARVFAPLANQNSPDADLSEAYEKEVQVSDIWVGLKGLNEFQRLLWGCFSFRGKMRRQGYAVSLLIGFLLLLTGNTMFEIYIPTVDPSGLFVGGAISFFCGVYIMAAAIAKRCSSAKISRGWMVAYILIPFTSLFLFFVPRQNQWDS